MEEKKFFDKMLAEKLANINENDRTAFECGALWAYIMIDNFKKEYQLSPRHIQLLKDLSKVYTPQIQAEKTKLITDIKQSELEKARIYIEPIARERGHKWAAMDRDSRWYTYPNCPNVGINEWYSSQYLHDHIECPHKAKDWKNSLIEFNF